MERKTELADRTVDMLQYLIQLNIDSRDDLQVAAASVSDATMASVLRELAEERNQQVSELRTLVSANCIEPESVGSSSAAGYRAWAEIRTAILGVSAGLLGDLERGEDHMLDAYEVALKGDECEAIGDVLNRHFWRVKKSHDRIRTLRDMQPMSIT